MTTGKEELSQFVLWLSNPLPDSQCRPIFLNKTCPELVLLKDGMLCRNSRPRPGLPRSLMTQQNSFEIKGSLRAFPLSELIVEVGQNKLSGSLRVANGANRTVIYFTDGALVFAVSNARQHRLFGKLIEKKKIDAAQIAGKVDPVNDFELGAFLVREALLAKEDLKDATIAQIEAILIDALSWVDGEWEFSPLTRIRAEMNYQIDIHGVMVNYARCLPMQTVNERFRSVHESFSINPGHVGELHLLAHESVIANYFSDLDLTIEDLRNCSAMPEDGLLQALYALWLGGKLIRQNWNAAFPKAALAEIQSARLSLAKKANELPKPKTEQVPVPAPQSGPASRKAADIDISLDEYLERVENAETLYEVLGIETSSDVVKIKQAYFGLAKLFHPDRYHKEAPETVRRIQSAFTKIAHAHETLKSKDTRETYDYKRKKDADLKAQRQAAGRGANGDGGDKREESAFESFDQGKAALSAEDYGAAIMHLGRAVHYMPENALFKAYHGEALSADDRQRHKAESELQAAVRIDPKNAEIRMMLVNFYVRFNMNKRAEGELRRFLEVVPGHREAAAMLAKVTR